MKEFQSAPPFSVADYVDGNVPQDQLDEIGGVMPLRNQELEQLVDRSCVAVVYDSDISINDGPVANLQGARYGLFFFTVLDVGPPGTLPESGSSTSLFELLIRVDPVPDAFCLEGDNDECVTELASDEVCMDDFLAECVCSTNGGGTATCDPAEFCGLDPGECEPTVINDCADDFFELICEPGGALDDFLNDKCDMCCLPGDLFCECLSGGGGL